MSASGLQKLIPPEIQFEIREVNAGEPDVTRVPSLVFYAGDLLVRRIEGELDLNEVVTIIKDMSNG
jgi:hypothetical protein